MTVRTPSVDSSIDCVLACLLVALLCCCYVSLRTTPRHIHLTPAESLFIHFIETSPLPKFSGRQCCALESAARYNRDSQVLLWVQGEIRIQDLCGGLRELVLTKNYSPESLFASTPLLIWLARVEARAAGFRTQYLLAHLGDALRLAVLYAEGGFYMDLDILSLTSISDLPRTAVAKEDATHLGNSFSAFPRRHPFLRNAMSEFASSYRGRSWAHNGPRLLERVLSQWGCDFNADQQCSDIAVLNHTYFYPVPYSEWKTLLDGESTVRKTRHWNLNQSHGVHLWNSASQKFPAQKNSLLHSLARSHCPLTARIGNL